jgi:hypothetical protein
VLILIKVGDKVSVLNSRDHCPWARGEKGVILGLHPGVGLVGVIFPKYKPGGHDLDGLAKGKQSDCGWWFHPNDLEYDNKPNLETFNIGDAVKLNINFHERIVLTTFSIYRVIETCENEILILDDTYKKRRVHSIFVTKGV